MRTTVNLDDEIYERARRIAFETRRSLGEVINSLLSEGLKSAEAARPPRQFGRLQGTISIADDFDETPPEILEALERPV